jgi:spermidine/putrescine transport system substrate-binding protein
MVFHPRDRGQWAGHMSRRDLLRWGAALGVGAAVLAACGDSGGSGAAGRVQIGTPDNPVKQPLYDDNPAIESGLDLEPGPLRIYNWSQYLWTPVIKDFAKEYDVDWELTTFYNMEEATRKLRTGDLAFDVFFPTAEVLPKFVAGKLLQPLNHDYLPNLSNMWNRASDPYYDGGSRYSVPYTVYQTGIGWRADQVTEDIAARENPWHVLWDPAYKDIIGLYDDYRETLGVGMYYNGITDINAGDSEALTKSQNSLIELVDLVNVRYTIDGAYSGLPEGKFGLHHAWSGDMIGAPQYAPEGEDPSVLRYLWPPKSSGDTIGGYVSNDSLAIPRNAEHPVLAHAFLNYMMDVAPAMKNFSWLGYQPPLKSVDPATLVEEGLVPDYLESAVVQEADFTMGQRPVQLAPTEDRAWIQAWSRVKAGSQ